MRVERPGEIGPDTVDGANGRGKAPATDRRPSRRRQRGQSLVEFALILPIFLVIIFGIVDFGLGLRAWITVTNSAREGARVGAIWATCDDIKARGAAASGGLLTTADITVDPAATCRTASGKSVKVTASYTYNLVTPLSAMLVFIGGGAIPSSIAMSSTSDMRLE